MWGTFANTWKDIGHFFPNFSNGNIFCPLNCFWQCDLITWYVACSEIFLTNWRSFDLKNFNFVDCLPNIWNSLTIPTCKVGNYLKSFRISSFWFPHTFTFYKYVHIFFACIPYFGPLVKLILELEKLHFPFIPRTFCWPFYELTIYTSKLKL